jgi:BNR repeat-like domain
MRPAGAAEHHLVLRDEHGYLAHPHLIRTASELLLVCNWAPRRPFVLHPPEDPLYLNQLLRSADDGRTWSTPAVAPAYGWNGVECAGLTHLGQGRVLLNQWRFDWLTLPAALALADRSGITFPDQLVAAHLASSEHEGAGLTAAAAERLLPWARRSGRSWVHRSEDGGRTWAHSGEVDTRPFIGGYGMRGGTVLPDGAVVLPLCDIPDYRRVFAVRSEDGGLTWSAAVPIAALADRWFEEPAPLLLRSGRLLVLLRENRSKSLWQTWSDDGGRSWAEPAPAGIDGYPAHLCHLPDGRLLCTYGLRRPPYAIRAALSADDGVSWPEDMEIRSGLPSRDLGYPCTVIAGGGLLTVYYARDEHGSTCIFATAWDGPE